VSAYSRAAQRIHLWLCEQEKVLLFASSAQRKPAAVLRSRCWKVSGTSDCGGWCCFSEERAEMQLGWRRCRRRKGVRTGAAGGRAAALGAWLHRRRGAWKESNGCLRSASGFSMVRATFCVCEAGAGATASPGAAAGPA